MENEERTRNQDGEAGLLMQEGLASQREAERRLLRACQLARDKTDLMRELVSLFVRLTGCRAVGVRLQRGVDFPYYETRGFPNDFVQLENSLCSSGPQGEPLRDRTGNPVLECMCGNILSRRFDPSKPFFTPRGSFWTNSTTDLLADTSEEERQARTRNRCNGEGYESVALVPLRLRDKTFGLFQFNDHRRDRFSAEGISRLEYLVDYVALALARLEADDALRESETIHRTLVAGLPDTVIRFDREGRHLYVSEKVSETVDIPAARFLGRTHRELGFPEPLCQFWEEAIRKVFDSGTPGETDFSFAGKKGPAWFNWRLLPEVDTQGKVRSVLSIARDISGQRQAEENYQTLFREMLDGFALHEIVLDDGGHPVDYRFLAVNPAFERLTGLKSQEIVGRTVLEVMPDIERHWIDIYGAVALTGDPVVFEQYAGDLGKHFKVSAFRPAPNTFACIFTDITDRISMEQTLRESEANYQRLTDTMAESLSVIDGAGVFLFTNRRAAANLAHSDPAAMTGRSIREIVPPDQADRLIDMYQGVIHSGRALVQEIQVSLAEGKRWFHNTLQPIRYGKDGTRAVLSMSLDITERKQAEKALAMSEERLSLALDAVSDGIWDWQVDSGKVYYSPRWYAMLGYVPGELPEEFETWRRLLHPEDLPRAEQTISRHLKSPELFEMEFRMRSKGGDWRWVLGRGKTVEKDDAGKALRMLGTHVDITDRKRAEEEREKLQAQLVQAQKMESVGRLAGGVAHDFNNMLTVIMGHVEMALDQVDPEQPLHADLEEAQRAARNAANLTRQLLAFARKQTITPRILDLNATVQGMLNMLRRLIGEDIDLVFQPGDDVWPVKMDPGQVDQILANLCVNARDAIAGTGRVAIVTDNALFETADCAGNPDRTAGEFVMLAVSDDGCGIGPEALPHLFEPFFTTKGVGKGTGLGLATVYGIVKQNEGFIEVSSEPGKGATFRVYLHRHAGKGGRVAGQTGEAPAERGHEMVLLVEDETAILSLGKQILERLGYRVLAASSPGEAISLAAAHGGPIDLLITDVIMPEMNGRDLAKRLLTLYPDLRRLFMSGYTADAIAHHGVLDPAVHFLQKPFSRNDLAAKVRQALEK